MLRWHDSERLYLVLGFQTDAAVAFQGLVEVRRVRLRADNVCLTARRRRDRSMDLRLRDRRINLSLNKLGNSVKVLNERARPDLSETGDQVI